MDNLILDFSHVYCDERIPDRNKIHWIDCSDITECDLYCSGCAADEIWASMLGVAVEAMNMINAEAEDIAAIGITNQRETSIVWDKNT